MVKPITFNIIRQIETKHSPFEAVIYILKKSDNILIEDVSIGRTSLVKSYHIREYLDVTKNRTDWMRSFNNQYLKLDDNKLVYFMPLFPEKIRFSTLEIYITSRMRPTFPTIRKKMNNDDNQMITFIATEGSSETYNGLYSDLYKNVRPFETDRFKLEFIYNGPYQKYPIYDLDMKLIPIIKITLVVPIPQLYSILMHDEYETYKNVLTVMKHKNNFFRFPYGNTDTKDRMCLPHLNQTKRLRSKATTVEDLNYTHIITYPSNGDYAPQVRFDNRIPTTLDIDLIKEKVSNDDFSMSYMDVLLYLSECKSLDDINFNIFLLSPNIPKEIQDFEKSDQLTLNSELIEERMHETEEIPDNQPTEEEPIAETLANIGIVEEIIHNENQPTAREDQ